MAGLALGVVLYPMTGRPPKVVVDTASLVPAPKSAVELLQPAQIVVVGRVDAIVGQGTIGSYNASDNARNELPGDPVSSRLPITDLRIAVETVIRDDGRLASGGDLILRMPGRYDVDDVGSAYPMSRVGDRNLFVLARNPDGATYGLWHGPWSRFVLDGPSVTYSDGARSKVGFAPNASAVEFLELIRRTSR